MFFSKHAIIAFVATSAIASFCADAKECVSPKNFVCHPTTTPPTLDGDLGDWSDDHANAAVTSSLTAAMGAMPYEAGDLSMRCVYDESRIYFAFEVPGAYRFDPNDDHKCASISTMMQVGPDATFFMMGGCPLAMGPNECDAVPGECDDHLVDIGGHWELKTTQMGVEYGVDLESGTGNDPIANKDDEYAVGAYCRFDDDDDLAANEWAAAWSHTNPILDADAAASAYRATSNSNDKYIFEMSRLLKTASTKTDAQLEAGQTIGFGVAYWDPNFSEDAGWNAPSHYVTGCSQSWINLILATEDVDLDNLGESNAATDKEVKVAGSSPASSVSTMLGLFAVAAATFVTVFF
jgi:hypothetical protein